MQKFAEIEKSSGIEARKDVSVRDRATFRQSESIDCETSPDNLIKLLRRMVEVPTREIDSLLSALQLLREKLQTAGNRIQRDIEAYATLSQHVMQLTEIISESVKKLPGLTSVDR